MRCRIFTFFVFLFLIQSCVTNELRMPSSSLEVYKNSEMRQALTLAASNKILFHLPKETLIDAEKKEVDLRCRQFEEPIWAEKLSMYLNAFRSQPELLTKFHVLELKKGDSAQVTLQQDMDKSTVLTITYVKVESQGKIGMSTRLPCSASLAEYIGRDITITTFEFPKVSELEAKLYHATDRVDSARFNFKNDFLIFLAQRGSVFKFDHELSFERLPDGQYVMAQLLNNYAEEVKDFDEKHRNKSHLNFWMKKIYENSNQASLMQFFGVEYSKDLKSGVKVESEKENIRRISSANSGVMDVTYVFSSYNTEGDTLNFTPLNQVNTCLEQMTSKMTLSLFRTPSSAERASYLNPGFSCP